MDIKGFLKIFNLTYLPATIPTPGYSLIVSGTGGETDWSYPGARESIITTSSTPTPNLDTTDIYNLSTLAEAATFGVPTGTIVTGQKLIIKIADNGTARTLAWDTIYRENFGLALPTLTSTGKTIYCYFIYNSADVKWDLIHKTAVTLVAAPNSDHSISGTTITLTAHDTQAFGDVCKINSDGKAALGTSLVISSASVVAMCSDSSITADTSGTYLLQGIARDDTWNWTPGQHIYLSVNGTTGNTLTQTAPSGIDNVIQILGVATHADRIYFNPSLIQVEHI
jgi:hypothetical protein